MFSISYVPTLASENVAHIDGELFLYRLLADLLSGSSTQQLFRNDGHIEATEAMSILWKVVTYARSISVSVILDVSKADIDAVNQVVCCLQIWHQFVIRYDTMSLCLLLLVTTNSRVYGYLLFMKDSKITNIEDSDSLWATCVASSKQGWCSCYRQQVSEMYGTSMKAIRRGYIISFVYDRLCVLHQKSI